MSQRRTTAAGQDPFSTRHERREDRGTFEQTYQANYVALVRLAYLATGRQDIAEDLVQDAFMKTFSKWADVDIPEAYLRTAVVNGTRSWIRRQIKERQPPQPAEGHTHQHPNEIFDALDCLTERQRHAVILRYYEGLDHRAIAKTLGCTTATARTLLHRALNKLRKEMEP